MFETTMSPLVQKINALYAQNKGVNYPPCTEQMINAICEFVNTHSIQTLSGITVKSQTANESSTTVVLQLNFTRPDGSTDTGEITLDLATVVGPQGPIGPEGPQGKQGEVGPMGPEGPIGPKGENGQDGTSFQILGVANSVDLLPTPTLERVGQAYGIGESEPYDVYVCGFKDGILQWINFGTIQGPEGQIGPQGPKGETGAVGPEGPEGPQGPQGEIGPIGPVGPVGPEGPEGPEGPQGPQGETGPEPTIKQLYEYTCHIGSSFTCSVVTPVDIGDKTALTPAEFAQYFGTDIYICSGSRGMTSADTGVQISQYVRSTGTRFEVRVRYATEGAEHTYVSTSDCTVVKRDIGQIYVASDMGKVLQSGTVTTSADGGNASAELVQSGEKYVLNLTLPKGPQGTAGKAGTNAPNFNLLANYSGTWSASISTGTVTVATETGALEVFKVSKPTASFQNVNVTVNCTKTFTLGGTKTVRIGGSVFCKEHAPTGFSIQVLDASGTVVGTINGNGSTTYYAGYANGTVSLTAGTYRLRFNITIFMNGTTEGNLLVSTPVVVLA